MAAGVSILINGVEMKAFIHVQTIESVEAQRANGNSLRFEMSCRSDETAVLPQGREVVKWYFNDVLEFAGRVETTDDLPSAPGTRRISVTCLDWTSDFDMTLISAEFPAQLAGESVRNLVGMVGKGFTSLNVEDGASIEAKQSDLEQPSSLMSAFAEAIEHQWYIDHERDMHFFFINDEPAPLDTIQVDTDALTYSDFQFTRDYSQVKNRIYLSGASAKSGNQHTDSKIGDGSDSRFLPLGYQPWDPATTTVERDGVPLNILLDTVDGEAGDGQGGALDCYLCLDNWGLRLPDNHPLGDNEALDVTYNYAYNPVVMVEDPDSIAFMMSLEDQAGAPSDGVHEMKFEVPELRFENEEAIWQYGQLLLIRHAQPRIDGSFVSWVQGWRAGQSLIINSVRRELDNRRFYVHAVSKAVLTDVGRPEYPPKLRYVVTISTSPFPV